MFSGLKVYFDSLVNSREIRNKVLVTLLVLVVFRLLASVPVVGIPAEALRELFDKNSFFDIISTVSGGVLETASLIAVGLSPYINASIIFQLLSSVIPKLKELRKETNNGRDDIKNLIPIVQETSTEFRNMAKESDDTTESIEDQADSVDNLRGEFNKLIDDIFGHIVTYNDFEEAGWAVEDMQKKQ